MESRTGAIAGWVIVGLAAAWAAWLYKAIFFSDSGDISVPYIFAFVAITAVSLVFYFVPTIIAAYRDIPNLGPVVVINFFLGWTFVGWVAALAMAVAGRRTTG